MNDSNRPPNGQLPPDQGFRRRIPVGPQGRGFQQGFGLHSRDRGFYPGRGPPNMMGRGGGPPPPPPRGRGDRFGQPPGRGHFPERDRFMDRGPHPMGRGFDHGRGMIPPPPPPPPPPTQRRMGLGSIPPPPPPRMHQGHWIPPPPRTPMHVVQQPSNSHVGPSNFNRFPQHVQYPQIIQNAPQQQQMPQPRHQPPNAPALPLQTYNANAAHGTNAVAPQPNTQSASQSQIDQAWTVHTAPNSMKFFHNLITLESTFTKPEALLRGSEINKPQERPWMEYRDAKSGKVYYSNGVETSWDKPEVFQASTSLSSEEKDEEPPKKKKKTIPTNVTEFASKSEAIAGFKGLLLSKDIQPTMKWNDVVKLCSSDPTWEACEILTQGERRQALAEYQTKRANELRDLEREVRMRAKEAFTKLLTDVLPTIHVFNPVSSRYLEMRDYLSKDDRFFAVEDEPTRETLFLEFCEEVRKRDERKKRSQRRDSKLSLFDFLREHQEDGRLTFASTWSSFTSSLSDASKSDPRFQTSDAMSESDRELYFSDFVLELQAAEDEKRRRVRDAKHRAEKAQREEYTELLEDLARKGALLPSTKWRNAENLLSECRPFQVVAAQDRDTPRDLFQDFIDEWNDIYRRDRIFLARLVQPSSGIGVNVTNETSYDEFCKVLLDAAAHSSEQYSHLRLIMKSEEPISSARVYFNELVNRVNEVAMTAMRRNNRRGSVRDDSSEDEGEIVEDGEIKEDD